MPGRDRPAHAPRDVLRRDDDVRRLHVGHDRGRVRRHDDADRLLHPDAGRRRSPRRSRTTTRRSTRCPAGDRRRLPHRRHRPPRRAARSRTSRSCPTRASRRTSSSWPTRAPSWSTTRRSSRCMQTAARDRRARDGARRERRRDRHHRQGGRRRGQDRPDLARAHAADGDRGRGDEPRDPARARRGRAALRRPRLLPAVGRADRARAREGLEDLGRDVHPVPLRRRVDARAARLGGREVHLHAAAAAEGAPGAPLARARADVLSAVSTDHCPFNWPEQKGINGRDFQVVPNGGPGIENRLHMLWTHGVRTGRITPNRFVELVSTNVAKLFGLYPRKGTIAPGSDARHRRLGSREEADDLGDDAPHERQLQPLRGRGGHRARRRSCSSAAR